MFKIRQVFNEKIQEFESSNQPDELNQTTEDINSEEEEKKTSEINNESVSTKALASVKKASQNVVRTNNSNMSNSMRPSNFEDGYKSDLY